MADKSDTPITDANSRRVTTYPPFPLGVKALLPYEAVPADAVKRLELYCKGLREFYEKHAIGSPACASCLLCGQQKPRDEWAITHAELPDIYICRTCVDAATNESV